MNQHFAVCELQKDLFSECEFQGTSGLMELGEYIGFAKWGFGFKYNASRNGPHEL